MQRPYTVAAFAAHAGSGDHTPPPPDPPRCACCGAALPDAGRVYCAREQCRKRWGSTGNTRRRAGEDEPTLGSYSR